MNAPPQGLLVPIDVTAFCVSAADAGEQGGTQNFSGATVDYTPTISTDTAFLGSNVWRDLSMNALSPLTAGVHIHWALPDAHTKANVIDGKLDFAAVPNRWLITRYVIGAAGAVPAARSWLIESDALSTEAPDASSVTVPIQPQSPNDVPFRYIGLRRDPGTPAVLHSTAQAAAFAKLTGKPLTAVSNGTVSFAAYYPECRNVFGMHDDFSDVTFTAKVDLMYQVCGWYSEPVQDIVAELRPPDTGPRAAGTPRPPKPRTARWAYAGTASDPAYTLYHGTVQGIAWDPDPHARYVNATPVAANAALANSPAEALAAYFRALDNKTPLWEALLVAFQSGRADLLTQTPTPPDQLAALREWTHDDEFATSDGGTIWVVVERGPDGKASGPEAAGLPLRLADDLNELNDAQQRYDRFQDQLLQFRRQLFADWYRIFMASTDAEQNTAYNRADNGALVTWPALTVGDGSPLAMLTRRRTEAIERAQRALVQPLMLKQVPAARYNRPADPVVLLTGPELAYPSRYGGDGALACRSTADIVTTVTAGGTTVAAAAYAPIDLNASDVPYLAVCNALRREACLLNPDIAGAAPTPVAPGVEPSAVALTTWNGSNPWLPIFVQWTCTYYPLQPTEQPPGTLQTYAPTLVTGNYTLDTTRAGFFAFDGGTIDLSTLVPQTYTGDALLSPAAATRFEKQLDDYLNDPKHADTTLGAVRDYLKQHPVLVQSLSGFDNALIMRRQIVQFPVSVPGNPSQNNPASSYPDVTPNVAPVVGDANDFGPDFTGNYNPVRAGFLTPGVTSLPPVPWFTVVDAFGQGRPVTLGTTTFAESMSLPGSANAAFAYLPPRLAQPARLVFRWLSADGVEIDEMNAHPAATPICGWMLTDRLGGGFFFYDQSGLAIGELRVNGDATAVAWQPAPGNDATIDQDAETVFANANPHLRDVALMLAGATVPFFKAFWHAVDTVHGTITPSQASTNSGIAVLVGRPVAIVQAALRLEVQGGVAIDQSFGCFQTDSFGNITFVQTDAGVAGVDFPVLLGDADQLDDGLIGFFLQKPDRTAYDLTTFYTEGATPTSGPAVVAATQTTVTLTVAGDDPGPPKPADDVTRNVLMLIDPRSPVHAVSGILPTAELIVPPDLTAASLSNLEMTVLTAPVLRGKAQFMVPAPAEPGFDTSWVQEVAGPEWRVTPDLASSNGLAVWQYTPQTVVEGWLRLNPVVLAFTLLNASQQPVLEPMVANALTLTVSNKLPAPVTFTPGTIAPEGTKPTGSVFYVHFGELVAPDDVPKIAFAAPGWAFSALNDTTYGAYWAATPSAPVTIPKGGSISIEVTGLIAPATVGSGFVYFDYYAVQGINDGVFRYVISILAPHAMETMEP